jgi:hypothetical protein
MVAGQTDHFLRPLFLTLMLKTRLSSRIVLFNGYRRSEGLIKGGKNVPQTRSAHFLLDFCRRKIANSGAAGGRPEIIARPRRERKR